MAQSNQLDYLINQFWNYIKLGEWELARVIGKSVNAQSQERYENILVAVALQPEKYSSGSQVLPTPFHLSWLASKELKRNELDQESKLPPQILRELEFKILLQQLKAKTPTCVLQELSTYHTQLIDTEIGILQVEHVEHFSEATCEMLSNLIINNPSLALAVTGMLIGRSKVYELNNLLLSQLFCNRISAWLHDLSEEIHLESYENFLRLLSIGKIHLNDRDSTLQKQLQHLMQIVSDSVTSSSYSFYNALVDPTTSPVLVAAIDSAEQQVIMTAAEFRNKGQAAEIITQLYVQGDGQAWMKLFLFCYHNKVHILQCVMDGVRFFINSKDYDKVSSILQNWKPLAPLILLLSWSSCPDFNEALLLLDCLVGDGGKIVGYFGPVCRQLVYQTKLILWCLEKTKNILGETYDTNVLLNVLFKQLSFSSVLSVLNKTKLLKLLTKDEVIGILKQQTNLKDMSPNFTNPHCEIEVFICYIVLKKFMNLITSLMKGTVWNKENGYTALKDDVIQQTMMEIKTDIGNIESVFLRVELLENIFALLFLRSSDLKDYQREDIDHDNIEEMSVASSWSQTMNHALSLSLESLSTIGDEYSENKEDSFMDPHLHLDKITLASTPVLSMEHMKTNVNVLMQEMDGSSTETVKPRTCSEEYMMCGITPHFLASDSVVRQTLIMLNECFNEMGLLNACSENPKTAGESHPRSSLHDANVNHHVSVLSRYVQEAQWRLELISGFNFTSKESPSKRIDNEMHIVSDMLSSSESLVYLTQRKGDVIQAKQVIKMFNLTDSLCSHEVSFVEELAITANKLLHISKTERHQNTHSALAFVKSAASAGKISSEVNQTAENILQHSFVLYKKSELPVISVAVSLDFLFMLPLPISVCKTLVDLAIIKLENENGKVDVHLEAKLSDKLKDMKGLLQLTSGRHLKVFELLSNDNANPTDFLSLYFSVPTKLLPDTIEFQESKYIQGQNIFEKLASHIAKVQHSIKELVEDPNEDSLKEKFSNLFAVFNPETTAQLNHINVAYDYFRSLFRYVTSLSTMLIHYKHRHKNEETAREADSGRPNTNVKAANPFLIFEESIHVTLSRLLFQWGMSPKRLETFAKQANVSLPKVIAQNLGVSIPLKPHKVDNVESLPFKKAIILNETIDNTMQEVEMGKCPNVTLSELLNNALDMVSDTEQPSRLTLSEVYQVLQVSTKELQQVDVHELKTNSEKTCFFTNLYNLMFFHALTMISAGKLDDNFEITPREVSVLLKSFHGRLMLHQLFAYRVGSLGIISAYDIYVDVFSGSMETEFLRVNDTSRKHWNTSLLQYAPEEYNPACLFFLSHGTIDSPSIQVLYPDKVHIILKSSVMEYLDNHVGVDKEKKEVFIPEIILLHSECFIASCSGKDIKHKSLVEALILSLSIIASPVLKEKLVNAAEEHFTVTNVKHDWSLTERYSPKRLNFNDESLSFRHVEFSKMSESISKYLFDTNPLIGTFVRLCLSKNHLVQDMTTIFEKNLLGTSKSNVLMSFQNDLLVFTKETADYSVLKNFTMESSSTFVNFINCLTVLEEKLDSNLLQLLYFMIQSVLIDHVLFTLAPKHWSCVLCTLVRCCIYTHTCSILPLHFLEFFTYLPDAMFDIICGNAIHEKKSQLEMLVDTTNVPLKSSGEAIIIQRQLKRLTLLINNFKMKCFHVTQLVGLLPSDDSMDLLKLCMEQCSSVDDVYISLETTYNQIRWCKKVITVSQMHGKYKTFNSWHDVEIRIKADPEYIINFLVSYHEYQLLEECFQVYQMTDELRELCVKMKLENTLNETESDYLTIQSVLESVKSTEMTCNICRAILNESNSYNVKHQFLVNHLITQCSELLTPVEKEILTLNKIGILAIELVPSGYRDSYKHLQNHPLLILEQLLLNMKVVVANRVINCIYLESEKFKDKTLMALINDCDDIVARYASLSLDISGLQTDSMPGLLPTPADTPTFSRKLFSKSFQTPQTQSPWNSGHYADQDSLVKDHDDYLEKKSPREKKRFVPPVQSVLKKDWVKDEQVSSCMHCKDLFNMFNRRHHCRHCGRVTCASCSNIYVYMQLYQRKERVCTDCYQCVYQSSVAVDEIRKGGSFSSRTVGSPSGSLHSNPVRFDSPLSHKIDGPEWVLTSDLTRNKTILEDFSFEQAPSASLCLAIVDLYRNERAAGGLLLKFCNNLSQCLQVTTKQDEIDVNMIAGMIEFILNHAKLKFLKSSDYGGVELCDTHLSRVEILKILLEANWSSIPTIQELAQPECLRRLRDQLIEHERFSLAMEVSNKCALDANSVHFIMGLSRLKFGNLEKAREFFSRCLIVNRGDAVKGFGPNTYHLERIIEVIESSPMISFNQLALVQESSVTTSSSDTRKRDVTTSVTAQLLDHHKNSSGEYTLDRKRYDEISFYLKTYGSHNQFIQFFFRHGMLKKALIYVKDKKCSHELFVNQLLLPCFQEGWFSQLCDEIKSHDPSLKFWEAYLNEGCRYMSAHSFYHCLYELQLFIKNFYGAALSCVRFYLGTTSAPPSSYTDLHRRLKYLHLANQHLEYLIKDRNRSSFVSHVGSSFLGDEKSSGNQDIPIGTLKMHLSTVNLQIDVTKFMSTQEDGVTSTNKISTLFGNGKERAELAIKILMISSDDSLSLASRIMQEYKLPSNIIFGRALIRLSRLQKYPMVESILQNIGQNGMVSCVEKDEILVEIVKVMVQNGHLKEAIQFVKQVRDDVVKINALILCGRLRDAYLEAVKKERVTEIQKILDEARKVINQKNMIDICEKWLKNYREIQERKQKVINRK